MTEQVPPIGSEESDGEQPQPAVNSPTRTGVPSVDAVLDEVEHLDELPLEEQLAAFEQAHESLRAALDTAPPAGQPDESA